MTTTLPQVSELTTRTDGTRRVSAAEFERLVALHQPRIFRVLLTWVQDVDAAECLTQECFLRAFRRLGSFRREAKVETWLVRIAVNLARDHGRNRRQTFWRRLVRKSETDDAAAQRQIQGLVDPRPSAERSLLAREELAHLWRAVRTLPHKQRTAFQLRFIEEMSLQEIAETLEVSVGTVKTHLSRAVATLRRNLAQEDGPC